MNNNIYTQYISSPIGDLKITANDNYLLSVNLTDEKKTSNLNAITIDTCQQLAEYFSYNRQAFDLPILYSGSGFSKNVMKTLSTVEYGKTLSYKELAKQAGNDKAARAIGNICNKNPFLIIVPCHRIVGSNGKLTGYAGGVENKQWLLNYEKNI